MITRVLKRCVALAVSLSLVATQLPPAQARSGGVHAAHPGALRAEAAQPAVAQLGEHFLRDAVPLASASVEPPDTTEDDFLLPEEKDKTSLAREIAVFVVASAFVAFFIIKVFIEEDDEAPPPSDGGKDIPPSR